MKVLLHPVCFPNIGTMSALVQKSVVWEMHDNYQKQTYRNRYHICTDQGLHKLSIPIKHVGGPEGRQKYRDVQVDNSYSWQKQHWRTLQTAYRTSPFFEFYEDELAPIFLKTYTFLMDFNCDSIAFFMDSLQIKLPKEKSERYETNTDTKMDVRYLVNAKRLSDFKQKEYNQVFMDRHGFVKNTSTLDLLFNEGPNTLQYLKQQPLDFNNA